MPTRDTITTIITSTEEKVVQSLFVVRDSYSDENFARLCFRFPREVEGGRIERVVVACVLRTYSQERRTPFGFRARGTVLRTYDSPNCVLYRGVRFLNVSVVPFVAAVIKTFTVVRNDSIEDSARP